MSNENKNLNRIKVILAEKNLQNKWLAEELKVSPITVSRWTQNTSQPDLETINKIANVLGVDPREIITGNS